MLPYFALLFVPAIAGWTISKISGIRKRDKTIIDVFFIVFLFLLFFRSDTVGIDLDNYALFFDSYADLSFNKMISLIFVEGKEPGIILLSRIIGFFGGNFRVFLISCSFISLIPIWKMYREEADFGYLMIVLFLNIAPFSLFFSGLRQAIALAIVAFSYKYIKEKRIIRFILVVFIAWMFHRSAIVFLIAYPIYHIKLKSKLYLLLLIPIIGIVYYFSSPIFSFLTQWFSESYLDRYVLNSQQTGAYKVSLLMIMFLLYTYVLPNDGELDDDTIGLRNFLIIATVMQLFSTVSNVAMRMNYYYLVFVPMIISRIVRKAIETQNRTITVISLIIMISFFTFYFFYGAYTQEDYMNIFPYVFAWE